MPGLLSRLIVVLCVLAPLMGCHNDPNKNPPADLPRGAETAPNPDFLRGSTWVAENRDSAFAEFRILPRGYAVVVLRPGRGAALIGLKPGEHRLPLLAPAKTQSLLTGYPQTVSSPRGFWFTDDPRSPTVAQLAVLLPLDAAQSFALSMIMDVPASASYLALLGSYVRDLDTMEWELYSPVADASGSTASLRPVQGAGLKGELIFRKRAQAN